MVFCWLLVLGLAITKPVRIEVIGAGDVLPMPFQPKPHKYFFKIPTWLYDQINLTQVELRVEISL